MEREHPRLRIWWATLFLFVAMLGVSVVDWEIWRATRLANARVQYQRGDERVVVIVPAIERLRANSVYQLFRQAGYLPTWIVLGMAIGLVELRRAARASPERAGESLLARALTAPLAAGLSGAGAELVRLAVRRVRPGELGLYTWDWPIGSHAGEGLGFPSSHAAVAAGAAFILARTFPGSGWVLVPLAVGCGYTRLEAGAHFASDVFGGLVLGWLGSLVIARALGLRR